MGVSGLQREIKIVGGGLAGLGLGIALRRHGLAVTLYEQEPYPRHKVCGEFIAGLAESTIETLGIGEVLQDARRLDTLRWYRKEMPFRADRLQSPALGISRYRLDERLAVLFESLGGRLELGKRVQPPSEEMAGWVLATGRAKSKSPWIGLKMHCRSLELEEQLEMHLGRDAYVGTSSVEDGRVNVCGLFRLRKIERNGRRVALLDYLRASGLQAFAQRVESGDPDWQSHRGVSAVAFGAVPIKKGCIQIGDAHSIVPPFAGDGMAMCFEAAESALGPLAQYSKGGDWEIACDEVCAALSARFRSRLAVGKTLHPFLHSRSGQWLFRMASSSGLLPFSVVFALLHGKPRGTKTSPQ